MPVQIPVASLNAQSNQTVTLDDVVFRLTFTFNTRCLAWDMTIAEQDGSVIVAGIKLLPQLDLLIRHKDARLPPGMLLAVDQQEGDVALRPEKSELGSKLVLVYYTEADVNVIISA